MTFNLTILIVDLIKQLACISLDSSVQTVVNFQESVLAKTDSQVKNKILR